MEQASLKYIPHLIIQGKQISLKEAIYFFIEAQSQDIQPLFFQMAHRQVIQNQKNQKNQKMTTAYTTRLAIQNIPLLLMDSKVSVLIVPKLIVKR